MAAPEMTEADMALTKSFKELVQQRVASEAAFGDAPLREGIDITLAIRAQRMESGSGDFCRT